MIMRRMFEAWVDTPFSNQIHEIGDAEINATIEECVAEINLSPAELNWTKSPETGVGSGLAGFVINLAKIYFASGVCSVMTWRLKDQQMLLHLKDFDSIS
ncbi:hypothetical protein CEXT_756631 [Caerostris extrusa]|uniref:Uncharacterized protein n=1 Tax=Caerostris extrusa TaxID=172846 RepID=A0AAV4PWU3_CAEEX|nr:hypothetical protein CEXT_756631 [Caerostris extrusa]